MARGAPRREGNGHDVPDGGHSSKATRLYHHTGGVHGLLLAQTNATNAVVAVRNVAWILSMAGMSSHAKTQQEEHSGGDRLWLYALPHNLNR